MQFGWLGIVNWVDILFIIILIRSIYIGVKRKLVVEFFKFLGILFSILISFHYYIRLATFIDAKSALPLDTAKVVSFVLLVCFAVLIFKLILDGMLFLFKIEPRGLLDRWGAVLLSILRGTLICSLVGVLCIISPINYLEFSVRQSLSGNNLTALSLKIYKFSYAHIVSKLLPDEPSNNEVFDVVGSGKSSGVEE